MRPACQWIIAPSTRPGFRPPVPHAERVKFNPISDYDRFDSLNFFKAGRAGKSREAFKRVRPPRPRISDPSDARSGKI